MQQRNCVSIIVSGVTHSLDTTAALQPFKDAAVRVSTMPKFVLRLHSKFIFIVLWPMLANNVVVTTKYNLARIIRNRCTKRWVGTV